MKSHFVILTFFSILFASAEELTEEEKTSMLEKVEALENRVVGNNQSYQKSAISVFSTAMTSDTEAYKLYEACKEKLALEEQKKKGVDVREALRKEKEKVSPAFKRALRYQLYWLVYSIEAARNPDARLNSANKLIECIANIIADEDTLDTKTTLGGEPLKKNPFNSVFAKVYKVDHLKPEGWPTHPLDFDGLYNGVIIKDLLDRGMVDDARKQWRSRLNAERSLIEVFADEPDSKQFGDTAVALDKYLEITGPALQWQGEQMFYGAGDKKNSLLAMYEMLEKHPTHPNYLEWVKWIKAELD